ncbi:MAG: tRNA (N(6)-L-threonylcarbamoyladenosine(37)-C(2))-methylthiotransferase MtaB [Clostridiaceae bacterium]|nr:tRNA (N(6)-L-threonylcarbamoyladenosine(37)-C(2))-methylthiotransferase MtaB [Clostridiaceae bacterium]
MRTVKFYTLGCKVNLYETEAIRNLFEKDGFICTDSDFADIYIINTCTVTAMGDKKSRQIIHRARRNNPDGIIAVIGCYAQAFADSVRAMPEIDIIVGTTDKAKVLDYVNQFYGKRIDGLSEKIGPKFEDIPSSAQNRTRAMLKIQDGCSNYCSYCIIPYARGPVRSREIQSAVAEAQALAIKGFTEIVLVGIHLGSYGTDNGMSLIDIIKQVCAVEGIKRVRLGSLDPKTITHSFASELSTIKQMCPAFHISMQSGCDSTLKRMNRKYTSKEYLNALTVLREYYPDCAISTDVMTGFPGEDDSEFEQTIQTIKNAKFSNLHVFQYSPREGTPAARMEQQVDKDIKAQRSQILIQLGKELKKQYCQRYIGKRLSVLFETDTQGFTANYIRIFTEGEKLQGQYRDVVIEHYTDEYCIGKVIQN